MFKNRDGPFKKRHKNIQIIFFINVMKFVVDFVNSFMVQNAVQTYIQIIFLINVMRFVVEFVNSVTVQHAVQTYSNNILINV